MSEFPLKRSTHLAIENAVNALMNCEWDFTSCDLDKKYSDTFGELLKRFVLLRIIKIESRERTSSERSKAQRRKATYQKQGQYLLSNTKFLHPVMLALAHCASNGSRAVSKECRVSELFRIAIESIPETRRIIIRKYLKKFIGNDHHKRIRDSVDRARDALTSMGIAEIILKFPEEKMVEMELVNSRDAIGINDLHNLILHSKKNGTLLSMSEDLATPTDFIKLDCRLSVDTLETSRRKVGRPQNRKAAEYGALAQGPVLRLQTSDQIADWIRKYFDVTFL